MTDFPGVSLTNVPFVVYEVGTGRIRYGGSLSESILNDMLLEDGTGIAFDDGASDTHWVDPLTAEVKPRPTLRGFNRFEIQANGLDFTEIAQLPSPCRVLIDGIEYEVTDTRMRLTADVPATYHVVIPDPFPFLPYSAVIEAK